MPFFIHSTRKLLKPPSARVRSSASASVSKHKPPDEPSIPAPEVGSAPDPFTTPLSPTVLSPPLQSPPLPSSQNAPPSTDASRNTAHSYTDRSSIDSSVPFPSPSSATTQDPTPIPENSGRPIFQSFGPPILPTLNEQLPASIDSAEYPTRSVHYVEALYTPVPLEGSPTELLADRFQSWRRFLKELISYLDEMHSYYDSRSRALEKAAARASSAVAASPAAFTLRFRGVGTHSNPTDRMRLSDIFGDQDNGQIPTSDSASTTADNMLDPLSEILGCGGMGLAMAVLGHHHRQAAAEALRNRDEIRLAVERLIRLRKDIGSKIREIRGLSSHFRNNLGKEMGKTNRLVEELEAAIKKHDLVSLSRQDPSEQSEMAATATTQDQQHKRNRSHPHISAWRWESKDPDPCLLRLKVDRQLEKQVEEENYLHQAYQNLESSGRALEALIVTEVRHGFGTLVKMMDGEVDVTDTATTRLQVGPLAERADREWFEFVSSVTTDQECDQTPPGYLVPPHFPLRVASELEYTGRNHPSTKVLYDGFLERKSKYLSRYSAGWYVLTPTHFHEFPPEGEPREQSPTLSLALRDRAIRVPQGCNVAAKITNERGSCAVNAQVALGPGRETGEEGMNAESKRWRSKMWAGHATVLQPIKDISQSQPAYYRFLIKSRPHSILSTHKRHTRSSSTPSGEGAVIVDGGKPLLPAPSWIFRTLHQDEMERWAVAIAQVIDGLHHGVITDVMAQKEAIRPESAMSIPDDLEDELGQGGPYDGPDQDPGLAEPSLPPSAKTATHKRTRSLPTGLQPKRTSVREYRHSGGYELSARLEDTPEVPVEGGSDIGIGIGINNGGEGDMNHKLCL